MRFVGIDPSTKTGVCITDEHGNVIKAIEITAGGEDPHRMMAIISGAIDLLQSDDHVCIEGFGFASQQGFLLGGIGWGMRMKMVEKGIHYNEVAPTSLKKFAGGKGNTRKDELAVHIFKQWGFEHGSDNVRDAFVLAQIARVIHMGNAKTAYQRDVIEKILNPPVPKTRRK